MTLFLKILLQKVLNFILPEKKFKIFYQNAWLVLNASTFWLKPCQELTRSLYLFTSMMTSNIYCIRFINGSVRAKFELEFTGAQFRRVKIFSKYCNFNLNQFTNTAQQSPPKHFHKTEIHLNYHSLHLFPHSFVPQEIIIFTTVSHQEVDFYLKPIGVGETIALKI